MRIEADESRQQMIGSDVWDCDILHNFSLLKCITDSAQVKV